MPYKISGSKSHTARIIVLKESDWSVESNTIVSGSGDYEIENLVSGTKSVFGRRSDGWVEGYGSIDAVSYVPSPGDKGVFAGGDDGSMFNSIDCITISTTSNATNFGDLTSGRSQLAGTSNAASDRGVFFGGYNPAQVNIIDYITISSAGDATDFGDLLNTMRMHAACCNGTNDRGLSGGSYSDDVTVQYITISSPSNATDFGDLSQARDSLNATDNRTNNRGIYAGGMNIFDVIDYLTISSTGNASDFGDLTVAKAWAGMCSNATNNRGIYAGGQTSGAAAQNVIEYVTISSTGDATDFGDLTTARRYGVPGLSNGTNDRGCFGGGYSPSNIIDYITISSTGDATDFGDLLENRYAHTATSNA